MLNVLRVRESLALACMGLVWAAATAAQESAIVASDARKLFPLIASLVLTQEPFPHDAKVNIKLTGGGACEVKVNGKSRVVLPVLIRFEGYSNSYCRLAVVDAGTAHAELVPIPARDNYDNCQGMQKMAAVDLNHDGVPDFVFQVSIPSNRYPVMVSEGAVYLSQPKDLTYCYAPAASAEVASDVPFQADKVRAVIEKAIALRGPQVLDCYPSGNKPDVSK